MVLLHQAPQALFDNMRIDLGGRNIGMAKQLLHRAQIGAPLQQMAGEGMAQHVRGDPRGVDRGIERERFQFLAETLPREMASSR